MAEQNDVRANWMPTELDNEVEAMIKATEVEQRNAVEQEELAAEQVSEASTEAVAAENGVESTAAAAPSGATADEDPATARGLERLVAREVELRKREDKIAEFERKMADYEAKIKDLEANQKPEDWQWELSAEPEAALKRLGMDPDEIVRKIIASRMGDQAPEALKGELRESARDRKIRELEQRLAQRDAEAAARAFVAEVEAGARKYLSGELSEHAPTVAKLVKVNPDRAFREIMEEISKDASARAAREPNGPVLPYEEAAKRVEARYADLVNVFKPQETASTSAPATKASGAPVATPPPASTAKPPDRPMAPWLQRSEVIEEGIKAGVAEYRRANKSG